MWGLHNVDQLFLLLKMFIFLWLIVDHLQQKVDVSSKRKRGPGSEEKKARKKVFF